MAEKQLGGCHYCFDQCRSDERYPEKYKGIAFSLFPMPKRRLEDCEAWIRACGRPHDQILDQDTWSALGVKLAVRGCRHRMKCLLRPGRMGLHAADNLRCSEETEKSRIDTSMFHTLNKTNTLNTSGRGKGLESRATARHAQCWAHRY